MAAANDSVDTSCPICKEDFRDDEEVETIACGHKFHMECIDTYASSKQCHVADLACPMCKQVPSALLSEPALDQSYQDGPGSDFDPGPEIVFDDAPSPNLVEDVATEDDEPLSNLDETSMNRVMKRPAAVKKAKAVAKAKMGDTSLVALALPKAKATSTPVSKAAGIASFFKAPSLVGAPPGSSSSHVEATTGSNPSDVNMMRHNFLSRFDSPPPPQHGEVEQTHEQALELEAVCYFCNKGDVDLVVKSKLHRTWQCKKCRSNRVIFAREKAPDPDAVLMTDEDRWEFWEQCKHEDKDGKMALNRTIYQKNKSQKEENDGKKGDFLPLSVWKELGYDIEKIEKNSLPEDVEDHSVLGLTYRVYIHSTSSNDKNLKETGDYIEGTDKGESSEAVTAKNDRETKLLETSKKKMLKPVLSMIQQLSKIKSGIKADKIPEMLRMTWQEVIDNERDKLYNLQEKINNADYKKLEQMQTTAHILSDVIDDAKVVAKTYKSFT